MKERKKEGAHLTWQLFVDFIAVEQKESLKILMNGGGRERKGKESRELHVPSILLYKLAWSQMKTQMQIVLSSL